MSDDKKQLNQSVNIGNMTGGTVSPVYNNQFNTIVAPGRVELSETGIAELVASLRGKLVQVDIIGDGKSWAIGEGLVSRLLESGITITHVNRIGVMSPPPDAPYSVRAQKGGQTASLVISPSTIP